jgi:hypothetical protein
MGQTGEIITLLQQSYHIDQEKRKKAKYCCKMDWTKMRMRGGVYCVI